MEFPGIAQIVPPNCPDTILEPTTVAQELGCVESAPSLVMCHHDSVTVLITVTLSSVHADENKSTVQCHETGEEKPSDDKVEGLLYVKSRDSWKQ